MTSERNLPPSPDKGGLLGLSLLRRMQDDLLQHCVEVTRECGDAAHYRLAHLHVFQFTHPDQNLEVLAQQNRSFTKPARLKEVLGQWNGNGLVVNEGASWVRQRRLVNPAFKAQRLRGYLEAIVNRNRRMLDGWKGKSELEVSADLGRLTLGVVAEALFGADVEQHTDGFIEAVAVLNEVGMAEMTAALVLPMWAPTPAKRRLREAVSYIDGVVRAFIAERRRSGEDRGDLLSMLLLAVDEEGDGGRMTDEQARDEAVNLMLGGNETTATSLTWALHLLSLHPEIQEELARESQRALDEGPLTHESLASLHQAELCFKETMRLYPAAYVLPREAAEDVTIGGYDVPRGATVHVVPYVTQRDPRWFDDPEAFRPSRFEAEDSLRRGAFLPFGAGPRACVGRSFAMMEGTLSLALIAGRYRITPADAKVEPEAQVSLHPKGGLRVRIEAR